MRLRPVHAFLKRRRVQTRCRPSFVAGAHAPPLPILARRKLHAELHEFRVVAGTAVSATGRANHASVAAETIAHQWPDLVERVDSIDSQAQTATAAAKEATRRSEETAAGRRLSSMKLAGHFGIALATGRS